MYAPSPTTTLHTGGKYTLYVVAPLAGAMRVFHMSLLCHMAPSTHVIAS